MSLEPTLLLFALVVFASYAVQTVVGFGSMLICVTLGAQLLDIREVVTLAVPISILQTGYIVVRHHGGIDRGLLFKRILPLMSVGTLIGFLAFANAAVGWLRMGFGVMILVLAAREIWMMRNAAAAAERPPPHRAVSIAAIFGAGLIHGVFATGGPLLVYAIGREGLDKHRFRSTLSAVWLALSLVLIGSFAVEGRYDAATGMKLLVLAPAIPLGIVVGEWLHHRVDERRFKGALWVLLIAAAVSLIVK